MKTIQTTSFDKIARKKRYPGGHPKNKPPKKEVNEYAVCHTTVDKDKDPDKYDRCLNDVRKQDSSKAASVVDKE
tara:strand:- start:273 stop:494 length:222 start_codon:yes stop_codon:yes gene_type:complete